MKQTINIEGIRLYAFHGCLEEEARTGQYYIVDVSAETDFTEAAEKDDLSKTVDYCAIYDICSREMASRTKLIEPVVQRIHQAIRERYPQIISLKVRVTKPHPPVKGDVASASVEIED